MRKTTPSSLNQQNERPNQKQSNRLVLVSWLFLIGSLIFTADAVLEIWQGISLHAILYISGSLLFVMGSLLLLPISEEK